MPNQALWDVIALNVRTPDKVIGDLQAQIAACTQRRARDDRRCSRATASSTVLRYADHLHDYAERLTRAEIREIPDGVYRFTDHIDGLGRGPRADRAQGPGDRRGRPRSRSTGPAPRRRCAGGINPSFPFTKSCVYTALRSVMSSGDPELPRLHAADQRDRARRATIVNPRFPGALRRARHHRLPHDRLHVRRARAGRCPIGSRPTSSGGSTLPTIAGYQDGKAFVFCETFMGTWGATSAHDGQEGVPHMGANQSNVPIEMIESDYPIRIERYGMVPDTGGPGRYRGGLALTREYEILADEAILNVRSDKRRYPPHGLFGGREGTPSLNLINPGRRASRAAGADDRSRDAEAGRRVPPRHVRRRRLRRSARAREPERVLRDVIEEKVTPAHARSAYGVVIVPGPEGPRLDEAMTAQCRAALRAAAG